MKALFICMAILAGFHFYGNKVQQQYHEAKAQISGVCQSIGNPFQTSPTKSQDVAVTSTRSKSTPTMIVVAPKCSGMDCYTDLKVKIPVMMASNI